jgi:cystathionine gamma-synthase
VNIADIGNSAILNPKGPMYQVLKKTWEAQYEDNHWAEDSVFLERNSRDFVPRIARINANAEAICDVLRAHPRGRPIPHELALCFLDLEADSLGSEAGQLPQVQPHAAVL